MLWIFASILNVFVQCSLTSIANGAGSVGTKQLFLSYGHEPETKEFVIQLKCDLERKGFTVWLDQEDIKPGIMNATDRAVSNKGW